MEENYLLLHSESIARSKLIKDYVNYSVYLHLDEPSFSGKVKIQFNLESSSESLWVDYAGQSVRSFKLDKTAYPILRVGNKLKLPSLEAGQHSLSVEFASQYSMSGSGLHKFVDRQDNLTYIYSYLCPYYCNKVFPCFDQPDIKGKFSLSIRTFPEFTVLSSSDCISSEKENNMTLHKFNETPPISTYVLGIVCGNFVGTSAEDKLGVYARRSIFYHIDPETIVQWTRQGVDFYERFFGQKFPFDKMDQVFCPEFNMGAMENVGCVTVNDANVWKEAPLKSEVFWMCNTLMHELCHMWFGNLTTLKWWDGFWLNESFATYFSYLFMSEAALQEDHWVHFLIFKTRGYSSDQLESTHSVHMEVEDTQEAISILDSITYSKGSALLKQLVFTIGQGPFEEAMKKYFSKHAWKNVEIDDFLEVMRDYLDVDRWSQQWLLAKGMNSVEFTWEVSEGRISSCVAHQSIVSGSILREHTLLVEGVLGGDSLFQTKVTIKDLAECEILELIGLPAPDGIIVNANDHGYLDVIIDDKSLTHFFHNRYIETRDDLNRGLLWVCLWAMVEKMKLPSDKFIDYFIQNIEHENNDEIMDILFSHVGKALWDYTPSELVSEKSGLIVGAIRRKIQANPQNKNLRKF